MYEIRCVTVVELKGFEDEHELEPYRIIRPSPMFFGVERNFVNNVKHWNWKNLDRTTSTIRHISSKAEMAVARFGVILIK